MEASARSSAPPSAVGVDQKGINQETQQDAVEDKEDTSTGDMIPMTATSDDQKAQNEVSDHDDLRDELSTMVRDHLDEQAVNDVVTQAQVEDKCDKLLTEIRLQDVMTHPDFPSFVKTFEHSRVPFETTETLDADLDAWDKFMTAKTETYKTVMLDAMQCRFWKTYVEHMCSVHGAEPEIYSSVESLEEGDIEEEVSSWVFFVGRHKNLQQLLSPDGATMIFMSEIQNMVSESLFNHPQRETFENMFSHRLFTLKTTLEEDVKKFNDWLNDMPHVSDVTDNKDAENDMTGHDADMPQDLPF